MGGWVAAKTQGPACSMGAGLGEGPAPIPGCELQPDPRQGAPFDSFILTAAPGSGRAQRDLAADGRVCWSGVLELWSLPGPFVPGLQHFPGQFVCLF